MSLLDKSLKNSLRQQGHKLKPVVLIGKHGLSDSVTREIDLSLDHHELIKIKVAGAERDERDDLVARLCETLNAHLVQRIGNVALLYRKQEKKSASE